MTGRIQVAVTKIHFATDVEPRRERYIYASTGLGVPEDTIEAICDTWGGGDLGQRRHTDLARTAILALLDHVGTPRPHPADTESGFEMLQRALGGGTARGAIEP
jgi:hypothetical protein